MAITKIKELTVIEGVALAFAEFGHNRFTSSSLTSYMCSILSDPFKIKSVKLVEDLMQAALGVGAVEPSPGVRGGPGFTVSLHGVELAAEVDLPRDKFERRAEADQERRTPANANAGPIFFALLKAIPKENYRDQYFIESLFQYWLSKGWLSSSQVAKLAEVATRHGQYIEQRHYVGQAMDEWTEPYVREQHRVLQEQLAAQNARAAAAAAAKKRAEETKALVRDANRKVKAAIKEIASAGGLAELDALVAAVFPNVTCSDMAKAVAFAGSGSRELRACIGLVAYGKPPSSVWQQPGNRLQPNAESEIWLTLVAHPACRPILERHEHAGAAEALPVD